MENLDCELFAAQKLVADYLVQGVHYNVPDDAPDSKIVDGKLYVLIGQKRPKTRIVSGVIEILDSDDERLVIKVGEEVVHLFSKIIFKFGVYRSILNILASAKIPWKVEIYEVPAGKVIFDVPEKI